MIDNSDLTSTEYCIANIVSPGTASVKANLFQYKRAVVIDPM